MKKTPKDDFNEGAKAVPLNEVESFLKELKDGHTSALVRFTPGTSKDKVMPLVSEVLDKNGGHVVEERFSEYGSSAYVWTGADGIRALQKLPDVLFVGPHANWPHPHETPKVKFNRK